MRSIELKANGELTLGWHQSAKGFKWESPKDGTVKVFAYMDGKSFDTMEVAPDGGSATLHRKGTFFKILRLR